MPPDDSISGTAADKFHGFACAFGSEVVEHDAVYTCFESLTDLVFVAHFHLDLKILSFGAAIFFGAFHSFEYPSGEVHMIVLDQYHVKQSDAVVGASSDLHGLFLKQAHARSGLAGVEHFGVKAFQPFLITGCSGGYAAHALHDIEHGAFSLQQRAHAAFHFEGYVAGFHMCAVGHVHGHLQLRIEVFKHAACHIDSGEDSLLLYDKTLPSASFGRDGR